MIFQILPRDFSLCVIDKHSVLQSVCYFQGKLQKFKSLQSNFSESYIFVFSKKKIIIGEYISSGVCFVVVVVCCCSCCFWFLKKKIRLSKDLVHKKWSNLHYNNKKMARIYRKSLVWIQKTMQLYFFKKGMLSFVWSPSTCTHSSTYTYRDVNIAHSFSHMLTGFHTSIYVLTYIKKLYFNGYDNFSINRCQGSLFVVIIDKSIVKDGYVYFVYINKNTSDIILVLLTRHQLNIHGNLASVSLQRGQCITVQYSTGQKNDARGPNSFL